MKFLGKIGALEDDGLMLVTIPMLGVVTQGESVEDCLVMAKDYLETSLEIDDVEISLTSKNRFTVTSEDLRPLVALFLSTQRTLAHKTIKDVTESLGLKSANSYAQYEQGKALPSMEKLNKFMNAIDSSRELVLEMRQKKKAS